MEEKPTGRAFQENKIIESTRRSLKDIGIEYADIAYAHRWETETPLEEVCRAYNWLIKKGLIFYWGTSAWPQDMIMEAIKICDKHNWDRPVVEQCEYNCLIRSHVESSYVRLFEQYGYGTAIWSPICGGVLSGKYNEGEIPAGSRYETSKLHKDFQWPTYFGADTKDKTLEILKNLKTLAEELGVSQAQLALAWILVNKDVSTCIIGASSIEQLKKNLEALELAERWNEEIEGKMNKALDNQPAPTLNWITWAPYEHRRNLRLNYDIKLGKIEFKDWTSELF